jgi:hypothetical protein
VVNASATTAKFFWFFKSTIKVSSRKLLEVTRFFHVEMEMKINDFSSLQKHPYNRSSSVQPIFLIHSSLHTSRKNTSHRSER